MSKKLNIRIIYGIVAAGRKVGGIHNLAMVGKRKTWRGSIADKNYIEAGCLVYNNATTHSSGVVKLP